MTLPRTFIADYGVQLGRGESGRIQGHVRLDGPAAGQDVRVEIPELGCEARVRTDADGHAAFSIDATPELWSPDDPRLYDVVVTSETDRVEDRIGFRTIETRGPDILLNGEAIFLRGISTHEESLLRPGRAHGPEDADATLGLVRELGANFVRLAHYPHDEHMARAADRLGLLVWAEIPLYWGIAWENPETLELAKQQIGELIERDRNRASVVLWSLSNETPNKPERTAFLTELASHARALDPTRLLTSALFGNVGEMLRQVLALGEARAAGRTAEPPRLVLDDPIAEVIDVVGWNEYLGWYYSAFVAPRTEVPEGEIREAVLEAMPGIRVEVASGKPLIVSEFGAGSKFGVRGEENEVWSEEYQARVYRQQLRMLENAPDLAGPVPLDPEGLPRSHPHASWRAGPLEPEGPGVREGRTKARLRRAARVLREAALGFVPQKLRSQGSFAHPSVLQFDPVGGRSGRRAHDPFEIAVHVVRGGRVVDPDPGRDVTCLEQRPVRGEPFGLPVEVWTTTARQ